MASIEHDASTCVDLDCLLCEDDLYIPRQGDLVKHMPVPNTFGPDLGVFRIAGFDEQGAILRSMTDGTFRIELLDSDGSFQRKSWQGGFVPATATR